MKHLQPLRDLRFAVRAFLREKSFTIAALLSLALGIGATTALFSVVYGVLLRPLPYREPEGLIRLSEFHPRATAGVAGRFFTNFTYHAWKDGKTISGLAGFSTEDVTDSTASDPVKLHGAAVTPSTFSLLGVTPQAGRLFGEDDAREGAPPVVVISDGLWKERFGGDAGVVGKTLILDGKATTVIGVAPRDFYFPEREGRFWTPFRVVEGSADPQHQSVSFFGAMARLKPGFTPDQAAAEGTIAARAVARPPVADVVFGKGDPVAIKAEVLLDQITGDIRPALLVFAVGVGFILLIACSNVASLQLTRGVSRQREIAVRIAMGASRGRMIGQLVTESLALSAAGGFLGVFFSWVLLKALPALAPAGFPRLDDIRLDGFALAFAAGASVLAGLLSGVLPALRSSRVGLVPALREGSGASASVGTQKVRSALVAAEAALAVVLLVGAGLLARSFDRLLQVDAGYDSANVLMARVDLGPGERDPAKDGAAAAEVLERVRALPGVIAAGAGNMAPFDRSTALAMFKLPSDGAPGGTVDARATAFSITPGYAEAMSLRLLEGRLPVEADLGSGIEPMLVNQEFVRTYLSDGKPAVGRRYEDLFRAQTKGTTTEIIGVVGNLLKDDLKGAPAVEIFRVAREGRGLEGSFHIAIRTKGDPAALGAEVRALVRGIAPSATLDTATLASRLSSAVAQPRFAAVTVSIFALLALTLSAIGLYGAMAYSVSQRRRELGVRSALGASRHDIVRLVLRRGLLVAAAGLGLGMLASLGLTRLMDRLLFGVSATDPVAFASAPLLLLMTALVACLVPAWRGASVPPTEALRCE